MRKLVLFDIDGTLVLTGAAGLRAMNKACEAMLGRPDALAGIPVAGRTDRIILSDACRRAGRTLDAALLADLRKRYVEYLRGEIELPGQGRKGIMPGIRPLLDRLESRDDVFLGLLTGNFEPGARIKLEHFDLWRYFRCGAYGDDAEDRNLLVPFAIERARACGLPDLAPADILVVGDTPHDVACARASGAVPVAVATGTFTAGDLRAAGAGIVFDDLSDTVGFMELLDGK